MIVRLNVVVLNRTVVDIDWRFDNLCSCYLQSQSELYHVSFDGIKLCLLTWFLNYVAMLLVICQLKNNIIGDEDS